MPALFEDIKCTQNYLELSDSEQNNKITTSWIKCFDIMNQFQQVLKPITLFGIQVY